MTKRFWVYVLTLVLGSLALYAEEPFGVIRFDLNEESEEDVAVVARPEVLRRKMKKFKVNPETAIPGREF